MKNLIKGFTEGLYFGAKIILVLWIIAFILMLFSCEKQQEPILIKYECFATDTGSVITYLDAYGVEKSEIMMRNEFKYIFEGNTTNFYFVSLKSINDTSSFILRIFANGNEVKRSTLHGKGQTQLYYKPEYLK